MSSDDNNIKHYSAEDIARYWQGKLSPQEMHAMEHAAMDDPFLADAMEGYSSMTAEAATADVSELRGRLQERTGSTTRIIPIKKNRWWLSVAAAIILLCGAGALTYTLFFNADNGVNKITGAASTKEEKLPALPPQRNDTLTAGNSFYSDSSGTFALSGTQKDAPTGNIAAKEKDQQAAGESYGSVITDTFSKAREDISLSKKPQPSRAELGFKKDVYKNDSAVLVFSDAGRNVPKSRTIPNNHAGAPSVANRDDLERMMALNDFRGRVLDNRNEPIPYASVRANNNTQLASADQQGNFQLRSTDSLLYLSISSVGYQSRQLTMRGNQPQDVVLQQADGKMNEVVVTGSANQKRKESRSSTTLKVYVIDAQPVIGWNEYNLYIQNNKRIDSTSGPVTGEVVLSFTVGKTGKLSNFIVEKTLGKQQDAEAIRLVKEGPAWKVLKNKKTKARIIIPF